MLTRFTSNSGGATRNSGAVILVWASTGLIPEKTDMKTAISIPDPVFNTAERLAKRLGLSRSELYVRAISNYLERHKGQKVTDILNEVYGDTENQGLAKVFKRAQMKSIDKEKMVKDELQER